MCTVHTASKSCHVNLVTSLQDHTLESVVRHNAVVLVLLPNDLYLHNLWAISWWWIIVYTWTRDLFTVYYLPFLPLTGIVHELITSLVGMPLALAYRTKLQATLKYKPPQIFIILQTVSPSIQYKRNLKTYLEVDIHEVSYILGSIAPILAICWENIFINSSVLYD